MKCKLCGDKCEETWIKYLREYGKIKTPVCSLCVVKAGCKIIKQALQYGKKLNQKRHTPIKEKR